MRRAQAGDQSAYEDLVRMHQQRLLAVVGGILRRSEDVEDVAQQALVKAYLSLKRFDQRSAFGTWLYKIAVNECWDYFRKKKVRPLVYEADLSEEQIAANGVAAGDRHRRRLSCGPDAHAAPSSVTCWTVCLANWMSRTVRCWS